MLKLCVPTYQKFKLNLKKKRDQDQFKTTDWELI